MKKEKGDEFSWWDTVPIEEETHNQFDLEDILREFGGEGVTPSETGDPALRSPIPLHMTRDPNVAPLRYSPPSEHFPQRQTPPEQPRTATGPECPTAHTESSWQEKPNAADSSTIRFTPIRTGAAQQAEQSAPTQGPNSGWPEGPDILSTRRAASAVALAEHEPETDIEPIPLEEAPPETLPDEEPYSRKKKKKAKSAGRPASPPPKRKPPITAEARYRTAQEGMAGRSVRMILCLLLAAVALTLGVIRAQGALEGLTLQRFLVFGEMALLILCAICAWDVLVSGILRLLRLGFDLNTLVLLETLLGLVHGFMCLGTGQASYCPLICLVLFFSLWGLQSKYRGTADTMEVARKTDGSLALRREPDRGGELAAILPGESSMECFLNEFDRVPGPQRLTEVYALALLLLSLIGAALAPNEDAATFIRNWTVILVSGTSLCGFLVWSRPWAALAAKLKDKGAALYGWSGAGRMGGKIMVPISDEDLFPSDGLKLNGVKFFGGASPDRVIAYGAAVMEAVGGGLSALFQAQLEQRGARRYTVDKLRRYDSGGVGAEILSDSVLVGSLRFMQAMGVDMPGGTKVSQAVYVAIEGELAGVFAVQYGVSRGVAEAMGMLCGCRGVSPTITALDFIITEPFLKSKFRVDTTRLTFLPVAQRLQWKGLEAGPESKPCALLWDYRFPVVALAVAGSRALRTAVLWGALICLAGGLMGMGIMTVLTHLGAQETMSLTNIALFQMIWAVPGILLSGWPKNI